MRTVPSAVVAVAALFLASCSAGSGTTTAASTSAPSSPSAPSPQAAPSSARPPAADASPSVSDEEVRAAADDLCAGIGTGESAIDLRVVNLDFTDDGELDAVATFACQREDGIPQPQVRYWSSEDVRGTTPEEVFDTTDLEAVDPPAPHGSTLTFVTYGPQGESERTFAWSGDSWIEEVKGAGGLTDQEDIGTVGPALVSGVPEALDYLCLGDAASLPSLVDANSSPVATSALQTVLTEYFGSSLVVDGQYGPRTRVAVKDYQRLRGLTVDGLVGPDTWGSLTLEICSIGAD